MSLLDYVNKVDLGKNYSQQLMGLGVRAPGVYLIKVENTRGQAMLSTLYVQAKEVTATITVDFLDFTTGGDVGEETLIGSHTEPAVGQTDRILISNLHNKPFIRVTVANDNATFSLFATAVNNAIDATVVKDGEAGNTTVNFGQGLAAYDPINDIWKLLQTDTSGNLKVTGSFDLFGTPDVPFNVEFNGLTTPGIEQTIITSVVPALTTRVLTSLRISTSRRGTYRILADAVKIGGGRLNPSKTESEFLWAPGREIAAGVTIRVRFETYTGSLASDLECYLMGFDKV
jgi:hypothetical protein